MVTETIIQQEDTIDLVELFWVLVNHWKIILLTMLITAMLAGVYYLVGVKPSYQADASIFITNNESVITVSDLQLSSELTEDYAKIIKSRNVLKQVIKELDLDLDYRELSKLVSVTNPDNSHIITITVTCGDVELCRDIANSLMNIGLDRIYQVVLCAFILYVLLIFFLYFEQFLDFRFTRRPYCLFIIVCYRSAVWTTVR